MTTEFEIEPRAEIERNMTQLGPLRNRQTLVVCILANAQPGIPLYDVSSLQAFRDKYWRKRLAPLRHLPSRLARS